MSKTDRTNPYSVRIFDRKTFLEEYHDHRNGECDLPDRPVNGKGDFEYWPREDGHCKWVASHEFWSDPISRCQCAICGKDAYEWPPRRIKQRRAGRRYVKDGWRKEY